MVARLPSFIRVTRFSFTSVVTVRFQAALFGLTSASVLMASRGRAQGFSSQLHDFPVAFAAR
jgi:hypothetical protein